MAYVQGTSDLTQDNASSYGSVAATFGTNVTSGNCIVVGLCYSGTATDNASVTDSQSNTYTLIKTSVDTVNSQVTDVYVAYNVTGGADTVTATFNTSRQYNRFLISEYSGIATTTPVDQSNGAAGDGTSIDGGSVTTTSASETIIGVYQDTGEATPGTGTLTAGSGFVKDYDGGTGIIAIESKTVSSTGSYSTPWTRSNTVRYAAVTVSLVNSTGATNGFLNRNYFWDNY